MEIRTHEEYSSSLLMPQLESACDYLYDSFGQAHSEYARTLQLDAEMSDTLLRAVVEIKERRHLLIVGIGGAISNPRTVLNWLRSCAPWPLDIRYFDSVDTTYIESVLLGVDLAQTSVLVISKSGQTFETLFIMQNLMDRFQAAQIANYARCFYAITGSQKSCLRRKMEELGASIILHPEIGGRFAAFSNIVYLPIMLLGGDVEDFLRGAREILEDFMQQGVRSMVARSAAFILSSPGYVRVNISYLAFLDGYLDLADQIFAESLGKNGFERIPLSNIGPQMQHSHLQLYLEGRAGDSYSIFSAAQLEPISEQASALYNIFVDSKKQVRHINLALGSLTEIGRLMMFSILETFIIAGYKAINPFGQPAVEAMKQLVKQKLVNKYPDFY
jgi:glucose-6-phosphate isomerase